MEVNAAGSATTTADKLIWVLDTCSEGPAFVRVISHSELGSSRIRNSDAKVLILVVGNGQIGRYGSDALTVGGQPAPGLSAENFPLTALQVHEVKAQPIGVGIHALVYAGRIVAAEVASTKPRIVAGKMVLDLKAQAGELRRGAEFADASLRSIAVREAA